MSNVLISFLFAIGVSTWVFTKFQRRTGNYTQKSLGGAALTFVIAFIVFITLLWSIS